MFIATYFADRIFGESCNTVDVYEARTKEIVASAVRGFNGTVFAYGQTSSGKTHTMRGSVAEPGIIPLAVYELFKSIEQDVEREFLVRMSYMEIYNEEINDLLTPEHQKLQIHENNERGIYVAGLREEIVASPEQVLALMEFGEDQRHIGQTNMNLYRSSSHTIFRIIIESREKFEDGDSDDSCDAVRVSVLYLVDLAGSERISKSGAEGTRLKEGSYINKSLLTLGIVIKKLSEDAQIQGSHVPYRDSKLTRILQPALGGNSNTAIICNVTLAQIHTDETKSTLQFASRALRVTNCARVNEILTDAALLRRQRKEIEELTEKLISSISDHQEEEILNLRNILLQRELEKERIALELEEEKKAKAHCEKRLLDQAKKIANLSSLVLRSERDEKSTVYLKKNKRRITSSPGLLESMNVDLKSFASHDMVQLNSIIAGHEKIESWTRKRINDLEIEKTLLIDQSSDHQKQIHDLKAELDNSEKTLEEQGLQHDLEKDALLCQVLSLQKEVSSLSSTSLAREKESLRKELDKTKLKLKDFDYKLKNAIQDKIKLEGEKAQAEREIKHLHGRRANLERDILKRDPLVDKRHETKSFDYTKEKGIPSVLEQTLHAKVDFLDAALISAIEEKEAAFSRNMLLNSELEEMVSKFHIADSEIQLLKEELGRMAQRMEESESFVKELQASIAYLSGEKEEMAMQLTDALLEVEADKSTWLVKEKSFTESIERLRVSNDENTGLLKDKLEMILAAISSIDDKTVSNKTAISKYIEATHGEFPPAHSSLLAAQLARMPDALPKRGRGRPPKPKPELPVGHVPAAPRPRGRPPKYPLLPRPDALPKRGRGRPPKPKPELPVGHVPAAPRPRGRPPKDPLVADKEVVRVDSPAKAAGKTVAAPSAEAGTA